MKPFKISFSFHLSNNKFTEMLNGELEHQNNTLMAVKAMLNLLEMEHSFGMFE
jgi:hypothetical protein